MISGQMNRQFLANKSEMQIGEEIDVVNRWQKKNLIINQKTKGLQFHFSVIIDSVIMLISRQSTSG